MSKRERLGRKVWPFLFGGGLHITFLVVTLVAASQHTFNVNQQGKPMTNQQREYWKERIKEKAKRLRKRLYERYRDALMRTLKDRGVQVSSYTFNRKDLAEQKGYIFEEARQAVARARSSEGVKERIRIAEASLLDDLMAGDMPEDPRQIIEDRLTGAVESE